MCIHHLIRHAAYWGILLFILGRQPEAVAQPIQATYEVPDFIWDGHFERKCVPDDMFFPYKFENNKRNNSPDIIYRRKSTPPLDWYWNEFGCLERRLDIPLLPFTYGCGVPGDTILPPTGFSGDRYVALIREPGVTEGLVFKLTNPLIPGLAYHLKIAARSLSEKCHPGKLLVAASRDEPCRNFIANQLHPNRIATRCDGNQFFVPHHVLLTNELPLAWEVFETTFSPQDTMHWLVAAPGNHSSEPFTSYIGIDALELTHIPPAWEVDWTMRKEGNNKVATIHIKGTNIAPSPIERPYFAIKPDRDLQLRDSALLRRVFADGTLQLKLPLPAATADTPGEKSYQVRLSTPLDCPFNAEVFANPYDTGEGHLLGPLSHLTKPFVYLPRDVDTLSKAIVMGFLPVDTLRDQLVYSHTHLVVDMPRYVIENSLLHLGPAGKMSVLPNSLLELYAVHIEGCGAPWEGLYVMTGAAAFLRASAIAHTRQPLRGEAGSYIRSYKLQTSDAEWDLSLLPGKSTLVAPPRKRSRGWFGWRR